MHTIKHHPKQLRFCLASKIVDIKTNQAMEHQLEQQDQGPEQEPDEAEKCGGVWDSSFTQIYVDLPSGYD